MASFNAVFVYLCANLLYNFKKVEPLRTIPYTGSRSINEKNKRIGKVRSSSFFCFVGRNPAKQKFFLRIHPRIEIGVFLRRRIGK